MSENLTKICLLKLDVFLVLQSAILGVSWCWQAFIMLLYGKRSCLPLQVTCLEISVVLNMWSYTSNKTLWMYSLILIFCYLFLSLLWICWRIFYNLRNRFLIKQSGATKVTSHYPLRIEAVIQSFGMWPNQPLDSWGQQSPGRPGHRPKMPTRRHLQEHEYSLTLKDGRFWLLTAKKPKGTDEILAKLSVMKG